MPVARTHLTAGTFLGLLLLSLIACGPKKTTRLKPEEIRPLLSATLDELVAKTRAHAEAVESVNAVTELLPSTGSAYSGVIEQYRDVRAFVLARKAGRADGHGRQVRMIGQAPVVRTRIFDMVADESTFSIHIPPKNKFIVGPTTLNRKSDKPIENLRPQHLLEAIFVPAPRSSALAMQFLEENEFSGLRYYVVTEIIRSEESGAWRLARKWWFDRTDLSLVRVQHFEENGDLMTDVHYSQWKAVGETIYPHEIELIRPHDDYQLKLLIKELTLNQELRAEQFELKKPEGAELVELEKKEEKAPTRQANREEM